MVAALSFIAVLAGFTTFTAPSSAEAAITGSLVTAADAQALSLTMAKTAFPSGSAKVVIAPKSNATLVYQAAALASSLQAPLILSTSITSASAISPTLSTLGATSIYLISEATTFSSAFRSGLPAASSIALDVKSNSAFTRSTTIAGALPVGPLIVGNTTVANSLNASGAMAVARGLPLIVLDGSEAAATVQSFFATRTDHFIGLIGGGAVIDPSLLPAMPDNGLMIINTADPVGAFREIALQQIGGELAVSGSTLWTAPMNNSQSQSLAALSAKLSQTTFLPAGASTAFTSNSPSHDFIRLWGPEATKVTLAASSATSAQLNTLTAAASVTRDATPSWTVTNMQLNASNYTITVKAKSGATKYQARTLGDAVAGESTSPTITVPGLPGTVTYIAALNSAGAIIDTFPMRTNQYQESIDRESTVVATIRDGKHHLNWVDDRRVPRLITRYAIDPFVDDPTAAPVDPASAAYMAITCGTEFTTPASDLTKQWAYEVKILSTDAASCGTRGASGMAAAVSSGINLPFMQFPASMRSASSSETPAESPDEIVPMPGYTIGDLLIVESGKLNTPPPPVAESATARSASDDSPDSDGTTEPTPVPSSSPENPTSPPEDPTSPPVEPTPVATDEPSPDTSDETDADPVAEIITESAKDILADSPDAIIIDGPPSFGKQTVGPAATIGPAAAVPGDDMAPIALFYRTYIPGEYLEFPGYSGDPNKPVIAFGADNREWSDLNSSNRTSLESYIFFGANYQVITGKDIGESHKYKCKNGLTSCELTERGTASLSTVGATAGSGATRAVVGHWVHSPNPVQAFAPAIDGVALWDMKRGGSTLRAEFDRMPVHQFWYGTFQSEAHLLYSNKHYEPYCLLNGTTAIHIPLCTIAINSQF
ncbi:MULTISPECIES: hypothetical protein [unclassified Plantibacter]|uniref:hypothetical protein n=1 Tax=unclassified Plantibacter TaxID=2624265 RepID=UPI001781C0FC|nr:MULTISPECIES: hypothetical protein [unclassified Plantibacter]MBD8516382.1 hypothetical protein [Plantibacter sp. CFBP 8804]MBD8535569.1 hypothetical protein [Plantibacter sp. CFBP 13570]